MYINLLYYLINDASFLPHKTPIMHPMQLNSTYSTPITCFPFSNRLYASKENVENVVNPPHTPVSQNKIVFFDILFLLPAIPAINPIRTAPIILVINVKIGNPLLTGIRLIAYLDTAPLLHQEPQIKIPYISHPFTVQNRKNADPSLRISIGFAMCPFMPASNAFFLSSSKAFAVIAMIGICAFFLSFKCQSVSRNMFLCSSSLFFCLRCCSTSVLTNALPRCAPISSRKNIKFSFSRRYGLSSPKKPVR